MPSPTEATQAREVVRMIEDFRSNQDRFFSKGYLNSDGKRAVMRLLRAGLQIAFDLKGFALKKFKRGSQEDIEAILREFENRLNTEKVSFKYRSKAKARTHE